MSNKNRAIKPVSFNLLDPEEKELLDHAEKINPLTGEKQNFSKYVRNLIKEDMRRGNQQGGNNHSGFTIIDSPKIDEDEEYTLEIKSAMSSFL